MNDLLRSQIKESCALALPEGLKELMCDISREVLRAQPRDLCKFISEYLSALLVTRENLSIASRVCRDTCSCSCYPELDDELRYIGLDDEDAEKAKTVILEHFEDGEINEGNIMLKIIKNTSINEDILSSIQEAVRKAFLRHQINHTIIYETSSDSDKDEVTLAARHTLKLYRKTQPSDEEYSKMAEKIQASYRAYGVTREKGGTARAVGDLSEILQENQPEEVMVEEASPSHPRTSLKTVSSACLAGSYLHLPKYVPYSVHDVENLTDLEEAPQKVHAYVNYNKHHKGAMENIKNKEIIDSHVVIATDEDQDYEDVKHTENKEKVKSRVVIATNDGYSNEVVENIENNDVVNSHVVIATDNGHDNEEVVANVENKEINSSHVVIVSDNDVHPGEVAKNIEDKDIINPTDIEDFAIDADDESECSIEETLNEGKDDGHSDGDEIEIATMIM